MVGKIRPSLEFVGSTIDRLENENERICFVICSKCKFRSTAR